ncbi:MAG: packaged DNA stabilization protein [Bryobacteraceae bacterium]|jgi:hypothetical protein
MILPGFIGPSYTSLSVNADAQRCLNMYLEVLESGQAKNKFALYGTPGLKRWGTLPVAPVRGLWAGDGRLFAAGGNGPTTTLYEMNSNGQVKSVRGTLDADNGGYLPVRMFANGTVLWIVSGDATYYDIGGSGPVYLKRPTYSSDGSYVLARMGAYVDGYFVAMVPDTNTLQISNPLDGSTALWDVLQSFAKSGAPDRLLAIVADHEELYLFGELTGEVWRNTGNGFNGFAFEKDPSGTMEIGISAPWSACPIHHGVAWIVQDVRGRGSAIFASGYQPSRISTHAVEEAWAQYPTITDAEAYAYSEDGHDFWVINFLLGNATWVWDATASDQCGQPIWHERAYNGSSGRQRQICHAFAFETHLVGDFETGEIWQQDLGTYTDGDTPITRIRTCPHLCTENLRTFGHQIEFEMEVGNAALAPTLAWSNDRGHTYGSEHHGRLSTVAGAYPTGPTTSPYAQRMIVDRLGCWRDRIFRLTITDTEKVALINAYLRSTQGTS